MREEKKEKGVKNQKGQFHHDVMLQWLFDQLLKKASPLLIPSTPTTIGDNGQWRDRPARSGRVSDSASRWSGARREAALCTVAGRPGRHGASRWAAR